MAIIAIDFDGTCVTHDYPHTGKDIGAIPVLKQLNEAGHSLILYTMRHGKELAEAVKWLEDQGVKLWAVNRNATQRTWTKSPKVYADLYIDDAALGCPLKFDKEFHLRPYVDWDIVKTYLIDIGALK